MKTRKLIDLISAVALAFAVGMACSAAATAAAFPSRPVKFILGFGTGGPTDVVARTLADRLSEEIGQPVVVENRTGASGNIATQAVVNAEADGYTYLIGANPLAVNEVLFPDFPVKFGTDIVAVAPVGATANVLVVRPSLGVHNLAQFIERARSRANAVSYATLGVGSSSQLAGLAFDARAGSKMLPVGYRGGGEALKDLLGGQVDAWFATLPSVLGAIQGGKLAALATTGPQRASWLPDLPTMAESGFPGFDIRLWVGVFARAGAPAEAASFMEGAIGRVMASKTMQDALQAQGIAPLTISREEFTSFVRSEIERARTVTAPGKN